MSHTKSKSKQKEEPRCELKERLIFASAVENFVRSNSNFESSVPVTTCVEELLNVSSVQDIFTVPIRHRLFTFNSALLWVMFLTLAPGRAVVEGEQQFASGGFSTKESLKLIASVYDNGVQKHVWEHFEDDDDSSDEEEEMDEKNNKMTD